MNNYHIYEEIGKGKYSVVYKGRKKKSIEYSAVKSLEKSRIKKVLNEVKIFHNLNHPNILKFFNWYETRNHLWIIVEYCPGGDLLQMIEQDKSLPENCLKSFGKDLSIGLQYLHSQGIIYCDLKPSNVLINEYGILKLSDFGLARRIVDMISSNNKENNKVGTPYYMAPELFQEDGVYSFQSDIWALGCILYELGTGKPPFVSQQFTELVNLIVKQDCPRLDQFSIEFNDLIQSMLNKDPLTRINWKDLVNHKFWDKKIQLLTIPTQPHFDNWVKKNNLVVQQQNNQSSILYMQQKNQPMSLADQIKNQSKQQVSDVNVLRLSLNVQKNLLKEEDNSYNKEKPKQQDVQLMNRDQEIDIGDEQQNDEEDPDQENADNFEEYQEEENNLDNFKIENTLLNAQKFKDFGQPKQQNLTKQLREIQTPTQILEEQILVNTPGSIKPAEGNMTPVNKLKTTPLEQLFTHNSDNSVKPIIGNKDIEKVLDPVYQKDQLPFQFISSDEVINQIESSSIENHFENIYSALATNTNDKTSILNYFETIVQHSNVSNRLINSQFMNLLLKMLKNIKSAQLKARIASIIGLLIRHATVIENELSSMGLHNVMIDVLKVEKNEKVRRRCISALGEYLFYGATQIDEDPQNKVWELSTNSYQCLVRILKNNLEDDIVKCYACKTIENITAQSVSTGTRFANQEIASLMINIFNITKNDQLRIISIVTLTHMTVLSTNLIDFILEKLSPNLIRLIVESNQRICEIFMIFKILNQKCKSHIQQALLTIINMYILNSGQIPQFDENKQFLNNLTSLLDSNGVVVRGKAILTLLLIIKVNHKALVPLSENKFLLLLDKLMKDQFKYVQQCLYHLIEQLKDLVPIILKILQEEMNKVSKNLNEASTLNFSEYESVSNYGKSDQSQLRGNLCYLNVLLQYLNSNILKQKIYTHQYLEQIFRFLDFCECQQTENSSIMDETKQCLFMVYENIINNNKFLINNHDFFVKNILSKFCDKFLNSELADIRFNCLKLFIDILAQLMSESHIYDDKKPYGKFINEFLLKNIIPNTLKLFQEQDPIPFYALKLINLFVEKNTIFVPALKKQKLLPLFIEFFQVNHPRLTKNTLKIISAITKNRDISLEELLQFNLINKTIQILKVYIETNQEWAFEGLLEIALDILLKYFQLVLSSEIQIQPLENQVYQSLPLDPNTKIFENFFDIYMLFFKLFENSDYNVIDKAIKIIQSLMIIYGNNQLKLQLLKHEQLQILSNSILKCESIIQIRVYCKVMAWGFQSSQYRYKVQDKREPFSQALEKMFKFNDQRITMHLNEIIKFVQ